MIYPKIGLIDGEIPAYAGMTESQFFFSLKQLNAI